MPEHEEVGFDGDLDLNGIRIILSLERLGELISAVTAKFAQIRNIDPPDLTGQEMRDVAVVGWQHCLFMSDREEFKRDVLSDLDNLDKDAPAEKTPVHKPEFGFFEPPV